MSAGGKRWRAWIVAGLAAIAAAAAIVITSGGSEADDGDADPFFGVVSQAPLAAEEYARMSEGGIGSVRAFFNWSALDPSDAEGDYEWFLTDPIVAEAARHDIEVLPFLFGTPAWVTQGLDGHECEPEQCLLYAPSTARALEEWERFAEALVERYGPGGEFWTLNPSIPEHPIRHWQIWNEQNSESFYRPEPDVDSYVALVTRASEAIRARDPGAEVILGGMFGTPFKGRAPSMLAWDFLAELYASDGFDRQFSGVGVHPYASELQKVSEQLELLREEMAAAGDDEAGLWVTEVGWSSGDGPDPLEKGSEGQAVSLTEAMDYFLANRERLGIENVTWFAWRDLAGEPICAWCGEAGLFEEDTLTPKPSWEALMSYTGGE